MEKPVPSTSSAPAAASQHPESEDALSPNRPPSPRGAETPEQETDMEACSTDEKPNVHTGTLTPKPEVCMLLINERKQSVHNNNMGDNCSVFVSVGSVCWSEWQPPFPPGC